MLEVGDCRKAGVKLLMPVTNETIHPLFVFSAKRFDAARVFSVTIVPSGKRRSASFSSIPPRLVSSPICRSCRANGLASRAQLRSRKTKPSILMDQPMIGIRRRDDFRAM